MSNMENWCCRPMVQTLVRMVDSSCHDRFPISFFTVAFTSYTGLFSDAGAFTIGNSFCFNSGVLDHLTSA